MAKTFDEKREAFNRMFDIRIEKAVKAVRLLAKLNRKADYAWTNQDLQSMMDQLDDAVDHVAEAFGIQDEEPPAAPDTWPGNGEPINSSNEETIDKLMQRSEVRWAYDALKRGDTKLAASRLHKVIEVWIEEEK